MSARFRCLAPAGMTEDIGAACADVVAAGGTVTSRGEFAPGLPYAFVRDPDGYEIEIWFETSTFDA
jgi:catechol 2,3-dioxygenase-like lactoylglutathione lyase family enzyme